MLKYARRRNVGNAFFKLSSLIPINSFHLHYLPLSTIGALRTIFRLASSVWNLVFPASVMPLPVARAYSHTLILILPPIYRSLVFPKSRNLRMTCPEHCSSEGYAHAQRAWSEVGCRTFRMYLIGCLHLDIYLFADVFEEFRRLFLQEDGLDPVHFVSLPGLSLTENSRVSSAVERRSTCCKRSTWCDFLRRAFEAAWLLSVRNICKHAFLK